MKRTKFTTIYHAPRLKLGLTCNEYVLMDIIYHLSRKKRSKVQNWCYAKKQTLADMMGISKRSIINLIKKLEKLELLTLSDDRKYIQSTDVWEKEVIEFNYESEESSPAVKKVHTKPELKSEESSHGVKKVHPKGEESSPPSNRDSNRDNNRDNNGKKDLPKLSPPSFDEFWHKYDHKKNKKPAVASWKKLSAQDKIDAVAAIPQYLKYLITNTHPQCHASTWLNNRRWEDDNSTESNTVSINGQKSTITQPQAKETLRNLYSAYPDKWKQKYTNQAQTDYVAALTLFFKDYPELKTA